jgi:ABC-type lipoprotein release transport system permease subunit
VLVGSLLSASVLVAIGLGLSRASPLLLTVAIVMLMVGLLATLGPARRSLRVQAVEALRADG